MCSRVHRGSGTGAPEAAGHVDLHQQDGCTTLDGERLENTCHICTRTHTLSPLRHARACSQAPTTLPGLAIAHARDSELHMERGLHRARLDTYVVLKCTKPVVSGLRMIGLGISTRT